MPGGDRTGPVGAGPRTGRAAGYCAGYGMPGYMNPGFGWGRGFGFGGGFGRGRGMGFGRGWRNRYYAAGFPGWARGPFVYGQPEWEEGPPEGATPPEDDRQAELAELREQSKYIQDTLKQINRRIEEIEKQIKT